MALNEACRKAVRDRVLNEMLGSIRDNTGGGWKVMILDQFTTRVLSSTLKMSDILDQNVSMVEDLGKKREPSPLVAVYFIQPSSASITQLIDDFSTGQPLYPSVHVFFSSKVSNEAVNRIKACAPLLRVLKTLKEGNLEFLTVDSRTVITEHPNAAVRLLSDTVESSTREVERELDSITSRLSTLLATLQEFPVIRYKPGKAPEANDPPGAAARQVLTQRLSQKLLDRLTGMQRSGQLPEKETCDMLILDRSYDPVAPFIHEWTYESMIYDLLKTDGPTYLYQVEGASSSKPEEKEATLDENDALWVELRHSFIAEVYSTLGARFKDFQAKNKAARLGGAGLKDKAGEMSSSNIRALIQALPQYREVLSKLSLHIQVSSDLKSVTHDRLLTDVGELEQDLVLGEKNSKDLINFLTEHTANLDPNDKLRLFMCYCATHPEKLDATKRSHWATLARLHDSDMAAVCNLAFLGVPVMKPVGKEEKTSFFSSKKKSEKKDLTRRKKGEDGGYALFRFEPLLGDILTDMAQARLSPNDYPYIRAPTAEAGDPLAAQSARTGRSGLTWAKRNGGEGGSGPSARRLIVFIIGGAVRSEMRLVHTLSHTLNRDIMLASTSIETPLSFIDTLYKLNTTGVDYGA